MQRFGPSSSSEVQPGGGPSGALDTTKLTVPLLQEEDTRRLSSPWISECAFASEGLPELDNFAKQRCERSPLYGIGSKTRPEFSVSGQLAAHALVVTVLALCDGLRGLEWGGSWQRPEAIALPVLYAILAAFLLLTGTGLLRGLRRPPWLLLALLQAGVCLASARLRGGEAVPRLALTLGFLQLTATLSYPAGMVGSLLSSCVALCAVLAQGLAAPTRPSALLEGLALVVAAGAACALASLRRWPGSAHQLVLELLEGLGVARSTVPVRLCVDARDLKELFRPLLSAWPPQPSAEDPMVGTCLDHLLVKLSSTARRLRECRALPPELRTLLVDAFKTISKSLQSSSLKKIPVQTVTGLTCTSPEIAQYVSEVLNQGEEAHKPGDMDLRSWPLGGLADFRPATPGTPDVTQAPQDQETWPVRLERVFATALASMAAPAEAAAAGAAPNIGQGPSSSPSPTLNAMLAGQTGSWAFDAFRIDEYSQKHLVVAWGRTVLRQQTENMTIDEKKLDTFLASIEERYCSGNLYHNAMHAVDVANGLLYFLGIQAPVIAGFEAFERLIGLVVGLAHDVGHTGRSNRFHTVTSSPLAQLFNDQSVLENMHTAVLFAVVRSEGADFLAGADPAEYTLFRSLAVQMILDTDIGKHVQLISQFRQEFLVEASGAESPANSSGLDEPLTAAQRRTLLSVLLKCADVGSSAKVFYLHAQWTMRIIGEFYLQGDTERALGLPCSPFCDRQVGKVRESQHGFFDFIAIPMFTAVVDYLQSQRLRFEVLDTLKENRQFWERYKAETFCYDDPMSNLHLLNFAHKELTKCDARVQSTNFLSDLSRSSRGEPARMEGRRSSRG